MTTSFSSICIVGLSENNAPWELVHTTQTAADFVVYKDYFLPAGITSEYALTQMADRFGDSIESNIDTAPKMQIKPSNARYWLIDKTYPEQSIRLQGVTADNYTPEIEEAQYVVQGRGRQFEVGEDIGIAGTLTARLRDQNSGGYYTENYNFIGNPNLESGTLLTPEGWTWVPNGGTVPATAPDLDDIALPSGPANRRSGRLRMISDKASAASGYSFPYLIRNIDKSSYFQMNPGQTYFMSAWIHIPAAVVGYVARLQCQWFEGSTARGVAEQSNISTDTTTVTPSMVLETRVVNGTLWYRIGRVVTVPTGFPGLTHAAVRVSIVSNTSTATYAPVEVHWEGLTFTLGSDPVAYFSGDENSGEWIGVERVDPSFTPGSFTARKQRQQLINVQKQQHVLYLRNPFGDVWPVHVSNMSIERDAGMASSEGVGVEIPYFELRAL